MVFFAAVFLAGVAAFLAGAAVLAAVFLAGALLEAVALPRLTAGPDALSFCLPETTNLNWAPGRNAGTQVGRTLTVSPVRGLRATRAARRRFSKTPKPVIVTLSPLFTARTIVSTMCSTASVAVRRSVPNFFVSSSMSSALFMDSTSANCWPTLGQLQDTVNVKWQNVHDPRQIHPAWRKVCPLTGYVRGRLQAPEGGTGRVFGFHTGLTFSNAEMASTCRNVSPMSSRPSIRRHLVYSSIAKRTTRSPAVTV